MDSVIVFVPLLGLAMWLGLEIYILNDWQNHCIQRRQYWLYVLLLTNFVGYIIFLKSGDRQ